MRSMPEWLRCRGSDMSRITVTETALEETWLLQGRMTKRSVAELVTSWKAPSPGRCRVVDLDGANPTSAKNGQI
jgi:hypothetical protein